MTRRFVHQDIDRCIGCYSCEVHCKTSKGLGEGPRPCRVFSVEGAWSDGIPALAFAVVTCRHCEEPACVRICPTGAMRQRPDDGVVYVVHESCVLCRLCVHACPYGAVQLDSTAGEIVKCDLCRDRLDQGLRPACVTKCVTGCLSLDDEQTGPTCRVEGEVEVTS